MIRRSLTVALIAMLVSLVVHGLGLGWRLGGERVAEPAPEAAPALPDVGGDFEELVEALPEPPAPDPAEPPETPEVTQPDALTTTRAQVASDNPQNVTAPDVAAEAADAPGAVAGQEADEVAQEAGEDEAVSDIEVIAPETPDATPQAPEGVPDAVPEASQEVVEAEETPEPEVTPSETETAALAPVPEAPENVIAAEQPDVTAAAVTRSLRPPSRRPTAEELGVPERRPVQTARAPRIESPITAYKRNGTDLLALGRIGSSPGGLSFSGSGGAGNAGSTNYAGRVLVKLNRGPLLNRAETGMARVYFEISPDGSLAWVRILNTSGTAGIGAAAQAQVRSAAPFPRPPGGKAERMVFVYRNR